MSRITGVWKRRVRPLLLTAVRRQFGLGVPTPRTASTVAELAASAGPADQCTMLRLDRLPRQTFPSHAVTGDHAAIEHVRAQIDNSVTAAAYDRLLSGAIARPETHSFVAVLAGGRVTHDSGVVMSATGAVLEDVSGLGFASDNPTNPLRLPYLPRPRKTPHTVAVLSVEPNYNYYHWLMDTLPRLDLYERCGLPIDRFYAPIRHRFQRDCLALLGIPRHCIVPATRSAHLEATRLVASSLHGGTPRLKTDFLFHRLTHHVAPWAGPAPRIFISRNSNRIRSLVNEKEVFARLEPLGFKRYRLETMSVAAQIELFHRAECVIGPHGAGLTNLLFCRPGAQVVEIGTPYRPSTCFSEIAHGRELPYHLHMARPVNVSHFNPQTAIGDSDLWVDPAELYGVVTDLFEQRGRRTVRATA